MKALLEAAVLAAVPAERRDLTLLVVTAAMVHTLRDAASEEALKKTTTQLVSTCFCFVPEVNK